MHCRVVQCMTCTTMHGDLVAAMGSRGRGGKGGISNLLIFSFKVYFLTCNMVIPLPSSQSRLED